MAQLKKILLVDDDDDLRDALSEQLVMTEDFDVLKPPMVRMQWCVLKRPFTISSFWMSVCLTPMAVNCAD